MSTVEQEELSECEVLWPETRHGAPGSPYGPSTAAPGGASRDHRRQRSAPVDIPRPAHLPRGRADLDDEEEEEEHDGAMVPPHLMVSRRWSEGKAAAFSLRSGPGRAHRDLSHLRNSVLRMTGFIEG
ncbi:uncharacterized protein LOC123444327 [Hordeum vulgare subsp. vulgare]|uniref:Predicted protein n=1 Tax=Hordeum vulgare subsp. vulgare TaxID=112509 RepID=F2CQ04_HORVV|nr:uncharacterized protein LOC123444327 [Hordeum vulgare subsp. vulgare]BAJ84925.1 predicted protein [Hordeum vulgare subsp. vulgare]BAK02372.1 predicted protein [Hordeum vulgare subsp. vulgare]